MHIALFYELAFALAAGSWLSALLSAFSHSHISVGVTVVSLCVNTIKFYFVSNSRGHTFFSPLSRRDPGSGRNEATKRPSTASRCREKFVFEVTSVSASVVGRVLSHRVYPSLFLFNLPSHLVSAVISTPHIRIKTHAHRREHEEEEEEKKKRWEEEQNV